MLSQGFPGTFSVGSGDVLQCIGMIGNVSGASWLRRSLNQTFSKTYPASWYYAKCSTKSAHVLRNVIIKPLHFSLPHLPNDIVVIRAVLRLTKQILERIVPLECGIACREESPHLLIRESLVSIASVPLLIF